MADVKVSGLPSDSSLDGNHYVPINDPVGPTTKRTLLSTLAAFFFNQANIPDGSGSPRTRMTEIEFDFVASGLVWSGDAYASTRLASMTSGVVYINGRRITISAVVSRTFTASKDTYIDILDNGDGTGTLVYTEVTNNAASPSLAANSIRIGIIVTGASNIAAVGSVNQGQENKVLPITSSIPYAVTDSLGNLICSRDPTRKLLGLRQIITQQGSIGTSETDITGLSVPFIADGLRKVKVTLSPSQWLGNTVNCRASCYIKESTTYIKASYADAYGGSQGSAAPIEKILTPSAGLHTYRAVTSTNTGTMIFYADTATSAEAQLRVERY